VSRKLSPAQLGRLLVHTSDFPAAWHVADAEDASVREAFWKSFRTHGLGADFPHVDLVASHLIDVGRVGSALDFVAMYSNLYQEDASLETERAELVVRGLEIMLTDESDTQDLRVISQHELMVLFAALERSDVSQDKVASLEWSYLRCFHATQPSSSV
jgi:hypothetical protein